MAAAHAETVVVVGAEAVAEVGQNRDSGGGVDGDSSGNVVIRGGSGDSGRQRRWQLKQGQQWQGRQ